MKSEAVIFELDHSAGFFSVFWFLCNAYIYAKENNHEFFITHNKWQYTYEKGWHDYFTSLKLWDKSKTNDYGKIRNVKHRQFQDIPYGSSVENFIKAASEIFILNEEVQEYIDKFSKNLKNEYTSLYVRRGDRIINNRNEAIEFFSVQEILSKTNITKDCKNIFLMTDDYSVFQELKEILPYSKIQTLCKETLKGSSWQMQFNMSKEEVKWDTLTFLASCIIFVRGKEKWSDYRSNVGRFLYFYDSMNGYVYPQKLEYNMKQIICPWN